jgi:hypothetical protein
VRGSYDTHAFSVKKVDGAGASVFATTVDNKRGEFSADFIEQFGDGSIVVGGETCCTPEPDIRVLAFLDPSGRLRKNIHFTDKDRPVGDIRALQVGPSSIVIGGLTGDFSGGKIKCGMLFSEYTSKGERVWSKTRLWEFRDQEEIDAHFVSKPLNDVIAIRGDEYVVFGREDVVQVCTSRDDFTVRTIPNVTITGGIRTSDGSFAISAWRRVPGSIDSDAITAKLNKNLTIEWETSFGANCTVESILEASDGGYFTLVGAGIGDKRLLALAKTDSKGKVMR